MGPLDTLNHLLNLVAPAVALALGVTLGARYFMKKRPSSLGLARQFAINVIATGAALMASVVLQGRDGTMAGYAAMALACATSQWLMARGWQR